MVTASIFRLQPETAGSCVELDWALALSTETGRQIGHWGLGVSMCVCVRVCCVCPRGQEVAVDT